MDKKKEHFNGHYSYWSLSLVSGLTGLEKNRHLPLSLPEAASAQAGHEGTIDFRQSKSIVSLRQLGGSGFLVPG